MATFLWNGSLGKLQLGSVHLADAELMVFRAPIVANLLAPKVTMEAETGK